MSSDAQGILENMLGRDARFRVHQLEAIEQLTERHARMLLVQRTGWGKSIVYFIATRILRDRGAGPTLLISPLLSLMRNQIEMMSDAQIIRPAAIHSENIDEWRDVDERLQNDDVDILFVSPERLANERFRTVTLPSMRKGIGMFVVDEAHCISDWGHDFRPDYRRIVRIVQELPSNIPILCTTATANDRVIGDIRGQMGMHLEVLRGPLSRESLTLQNIVLADQAERMAWLAQNIPRLKGSGVIYCLTVADTRRVAEWLKKKGINAEAYNADLDSEERIRLENALIGNKIKALVATVALGMGFDKPDIGFVIHYQRPGSAIAYYQQVGRAGRAIDGAYGVLLSGKEDDDIQNYFIDAAFPPEDEMKDILKIIADSENGETINEIQEHINISRGGIAKILKLLEIDGAVAVEKIPRKAARYMRTLADWTLDSERILRVTEQRRSEMERMSAYVGHTQCLMEFLCRELDDPWVMKCSKCAGCAGRPMISDSVDGVIVREAISFLKRNCRVIKPRQMWPAGGILGVKGKISSGEQNFEGRALCIYGDAGWGREVAHGKYSTGRFSDDLVEASVELIEQMWKLEPSPGWVTAVPSLRSPDLVPGFAERLAAGLGIPFIPAVVKSRENAPQKDMKNTYQQVANLMDVFNLREPCPREAVLLVDDMVDSGWTLTIIGRLLRMAGVEKVYPFALADARNKGDE